MYNPQDPVGKVTETMAKLFAVMADEVLQEMGQEKGEAVVKRAVRRFANMRAQKIIENIKKDGKEVTFHTVEEYSDYPANEAWDCDSFVEGNTLREINRVCPFSTAFREIGLENAGKLYCEEIDIALNEAFFGKIDFKRFREIADEGWTSRKSNSLFTDGPCAPCEMIVTCLEDQTK
jgi:hypothetical protein